MLPSALRAVRMVSSFQQIRTEKENQYTASPAMTIRCTWLVPS